MELVPETRQLFADVTQGGALWHFIRKELVSFTSSSVANILGCGYSSRSKEAQKILIQYKEKERSEMEKDEGSDPDLCELSERSESAYVMAAMEYGLNTEPEAFEFFSRLFPNNLYRYSPGFYTWARHPEIGASPDCVYYDTLRKRLCVLEIKCPYSGNWHDTDDAAELLKRKPQYFIQIQFQMACTGATHGVLMVYFPEEGIQPQCAKCVRMRYNKTFMGIAMGLLKAFEEKVKVHAKRKVRNKRAFYFKKEEKAEVKAMIEAAIDNSVLLTGVVHLTN